MTALDLLWPGAGRLAGDGAMLAAAAVALLEAGEAGAGFAVAELVADPALRLVLASAAEARCLAGRREQLVTAARAVPAAGRGAALVAAEPYLARIDARWAGALPRLLELEIPAYGFDVAARLDQAPSGAVRGSAKERQLHADAVGRLATGGELRDRAQLSPLGEISRLHPGEAASYLVAAACVDSLWALEVADAMLERHPPGTLIAALRLVAAAAVTAGHATAVADRVAKPDFVIGQATWFAVACQAGAVTDDARDLAARLVPRVTDELDESDELLAGLPLLEGLAHAMAVEEFGAAALEWAVPAAVLVDLLFTSGATAAAAHPGVAAVVAACPPGEPDVSWWPERGSADEQASAITAALCVAAGPPWWPLPGTLADLLHWQHR